MPDFAKRSVGLLLLGLIGAIAVPASAAQRDDGLLWRPRLPTPAVVALDSAENRQFTAEVKGSKSATGWTAAIANDLKSWDCQVVSAVYSTINRGTEPGWKITLRVAADAPPELFALHVSSNEAECVQEQSVSVTPKFATDFYILHLSDEQIVNEKHTDPSGQYYRTVGTVEEMHWMQEPINLIHPRLAIVTGDQIDFNGALDGWNNWHNWGYEPGSQKHFSAKETREIETRLSNMYMECHRGYHVPYAEAPGNHDVTPADKKLRYSETFWHPISVEMYEKYFGQRSWSLHMGDFYVLMHDWTEQSLKQWAAEDYAQALADPAVKFRLIGQHSNTDQAFIPDRCDLMLIGHGHRTATIQTTPFYIYEDGPTFKYGTTGFFNFHRMANGWVCDQTGGERDTHKDVWPLFTDNGLTKKVRCDRPDSNYVTEKSITITNDLPTHFYDGRVRFVLTQGNYRTVRNGVILAQYNAGGNQTAVVVKVDIPANGTVTVTVE